MGPHTANFPPGFFSKSHSKYLARELPISVLYPLFTGKLSLQSDQQYWYLCADQDESKGSEATQVTKKRDFGYFALPSQCYGVDKDQDIIKKNKELLPNFHWIPDMWTRAIKKSKKFNPGLVHFDTTYFGEGYPASRDLKETLNFCKDIENVLLIVNVMMNNPRAGMNGGEEFDPAALIENVILDDHPKTYAMWNVSWEDPDINVYHSYEYKTNKTLMRSYIFFNGILPKEEEIKKEFDKYKDWCSHFSDILHN